MLRFKQTPGNCQYDPEFILHVDGKPSRVQIQDCRGYGGGYAVNLFAPEGEHWMRHRGDFRSLAKAKARALAIYREEVDTPIRS